MEGRGLSRNPKPFYGVGCGQEYEGTMQPRLDHFPKASERIQAALDLNEATGGGGLQPVQSGWPRSEAWPENEELPLLPGNDDARVLKNRLRQILIALAQAETVATYRSLAERLRLMPPQAVHRGAGLLEKLMAEDAEAGRPLLAALCVGRQRHGLPAPGFFMAAEALRLFEGGPEGPAARDFHTRELACAFDYYRQFRNG